MLVSLKQQNWRLMQNFSCEICFRVHLAETLVHLHVLVLSLKVVLVLHLLLYLYLLLPLNTILSTSSEVLSMTSLTLQVESD